MQVIWYKLGKGKIRVLMDGPNFNLKTPRLLRKI